MIFCFALRHIKCSPKLNQLVCRSFLFSAKLPKENHMDASSMKVVELRSFLKAENLSSKGNKEELVKRVNEFRMSKSENEVNRSENNITPTCTKQGAFPEPTPSVSEVPAKETSEEMLTTTTDDSNTNGNGKKTEVAENKTSSPTSNPPSAKKRKLSPGLLKQTGPSLPKTPVQLVNERRPGLKYETVSVTGPAHALRFKMKVTMDGRDYFAEGGSKKEAKQMVASEIVRGFLQMEAPHILAPRIAKPIGEIDFTSDDPVDWLFDQGPPAMPSPMATPPLLASPIPAEMYGPRIQSPANGKNPVQLLNEMKPGLTYTCLDGSSDSKSFTMEVEVKDQKYHGFGKSKKLAKLGVATKVLQQVFGMSVAPPDQQSVPSNLEENSDELLPYAGTIPDLVYDLVRSKFGELTDNFTSETSKHKVLAGIVMTRDNGADVSDGVVVSLATGTKCVRGEYISDQGSALFDCHAEIVSRRGLRRFLYQQLIQYDSDKAESIFEPTEGGLFRLKSDVFFHLYISTSPCGDARIFSPHETEDGDNHPNRKSRGQLRSKIENGEGTIPVEEGNNVTEKGRNNIQQTWDGVLSGERLLTMSCSDKIAKWNVVGLQGCLLSHYIRPVYLSSIILGSLYHSQHLQRGVFGRAREAISAMTAQSDADVFPEHYRMHRPLLASVTSRERRTAKRAPSFALHWTDGDDQPCIINTGTGRTDDNLSSNLCKKEMLKLFFQARQSNQAIERLPGITSSKTYGELKAMAKEYQGLKNVLMSGFSKSSCGAWIGKPSEVDMFTFTPTNS